MVLLTKEEGLQYIQNVLDIAASEVPDNSSSLLIKLSFLETLIRAFLEREPFQSIYLMSHDVNSRRRPTWDEVKRDLLLGRGGLCYWLNAFMYALLSSLGFNASMTYSTYNVGIYSPNNHVIVFLHDLSAPGSLHLVDVGLGYYIPRAISLDFTTESPEYTDSFMTYKFQRESENKMFLCKMVVQDTIMTTTELTKEDTDEHKVVNASINEAESCRNINNDLQVNKPNGCNKENETNKNIAVNGTQKNETKQSISWSKLYFFNPLIALKNLEAFYPPFDDCFSDVTRLSTHTSPRAMCWPGGRFLALVNSKLIQEKEKGKLTKSSIIDVIVRSKPPSASQKLCPVSDSIKQQTPGETTNGTENTNNTPDTTVTNEAENGTKNQNQCQLSDMKPLVDAYKKHFPQFSSEMVLAALKNWIATGTIFPVPEHLA